MADHTEFLELARELIADDGRLVTFAQMPDTPVDPARPWKGAGGAPVLRNPVETFAVFLPDGTLGTLGSGGGFGSLSEVNELFKSSEQLLLVAPPSSGEDLSTYHVIIDEDDTGAAVRWRINAFKQLKPANLTVLFAMGVSR